MLCFNFQDVCAYSVAQFFHLFETLWTVARQILLSMGFPRQEYWSGLPFPSPGDLPNPRIECTPPGHLLWQVDSLPLSHLGRPTFKTITAKLVMTEDSFTPPVCPWLKNVATKS